MSPERRWETVFSDMRDPVPSRMTYCFVMKSVQTLRKQNGSPWVCRKLVQFFKYIDILAYTVI